jgi:hypothetical protein
MESFRQQQMKRDKFTQPGWEDAVYYFRERDEKWQTAELRIPVVVQPQPHDDASALSPTTFG